MDKDQVKEQLADASAEVAEITASKLELAADLIAKTATTLSTLSEKLAEKEATEVYEKTKEIDNDSFRKMFAEATEAKKAELLETYGARAIELAVTPSSIAKMVMSPLAKSDPQVELKKEVQEMHDTLHILTAMNKGITKATTGGDKSTVNKDVMRHSIATLQKTTPYITPAQQSYLKGVNDALDSITAGDGLEAVPINMSNNFIEEMFLQLRVAGLFPRITMTSGTFRLPALTSRPNARFVAQGTTPAQFGTNMGVSETFDTYEVNLIARKLMTETIWSDEVEEDAIIPFVAEVRRYLLNGHAAAIENAVINGNAVNSGTTLDNAATGKLWTAADDARAAFNGIRKEREVLNQAATSVDGSTLSLASIRSARAALGKYGVNPAELALIVSPRVYMRLLGLPEVVTVQNFGTGATVLNGGLVQIDGVPIIVSEFIYENLNANGVFDNVTTNRGLAVLVNVNAYRFGVRRDVRVESDRSVLSGQNVIVSTNRVDFKKARPLQAEEAIIRGITL